MFNLSQWLICIPWRIRLVLLFFFGCSMDPSIYTPFISVSINIPAPAGSVMGMIWGFHCSIGQPCGWFPQGRVLLVCNEEDEKVIGGKLEDRFKPPGQLFEFWDLRGLDSIVKKKHTNFTRGFEVQIPGMPQIPRIKKTVFDGVCLNMGIPICPISWDCHHFWRFDLEFWFRLHDSLGLQKMPVSAPSFLKRRRPQKKRVRLEGCLK